MRHTCGNRYLGGGEQVLDNGARWVGFTVHCDDVGGWMIVIGAWLGDEMGRQSGKPEGFLVEGDPVHVGVLDAILDILTTFIRDGYDGYIFYVFGY